MVQNVSNICEPGGDFWGKAYEKYFCPLCVSACRSLTDGNWADAEDLVAAGFTRVMRCYATNPEAIDNLLGYLWVVIKRLSFEKRRREKSSKTDSLEVLMNTNRHPTVEPSAEHDVEVKELIQLLQANLDSLTPLQREVLRLHLKGCKPREIAAELNKDVHTIYTEIAALKATLRSALTKQKAKTTRQGQP